MLRVTLLENLSSALIQIALFYFTTQRLEFSPAENLALAVVHGAVYIVGALLSHGMAERVGERRLLAGIFALQMVGVGVLALSPMRLTVWLVTPALLTIYGMKWPIIESYITAGKTPREAAKALGRFNPVWSGAVAVSTLASGLLIELSTAALFLTSLGATVCSMGLLFHVAGPTAEHLPDDHPERPDPSQSARLERLLSSSRWSLLISYALLQVINPLMPTLTEQLGVTLVWATVVGATPLVVRTLMFVVMQHVDAWHYRRWPLAAAAVLLPIAGLIVIDGRSLGLLIGGGAVFGLAAGVAYYAALWYASTLKNAAVDAGGKHEAVIGVGFVSGPLLGTGAAQLTAATAWTRLPSYSLALVPLFAVCTTKALLALRSTESSSAPAAGRRTADGAAMKDS